METVTLQGPIVVLPADTYHELLTRLAQLERTVAQLSALSENVEDIRFMREAEVEYRTGDGASFAAILDEVISETE